MTKTDTADKKKPTKKPVQKKIVKTLWIIFFAVILFILTVFVGINNEVFCDMPPIEDLQNPIDKYASQVYSSDGVLLGTIAADKNNRIYSNYKELPQYLVDGILATEDVRFYSHSGIDFQGLTAAVWRTLSGKKTSGGSTITQQLAKQLYTRETAKSVGERLFQKPIEWVIAVKLERFYTKEEILNLYINKYDFNHNAVGIRSAARIFFNKQPKELNMEESATLVGMLNNSSYYSPRRYPDRTRERRNLVFNQMRKYNYISQSQCDSLKQLPLVLDYKPANHIDGLAPYLREYIRRMLAMNKPDKSKYASYSYQQYKRDSIAWENDPLYGWSNKNKKADGSYYDLTKDGLKIYTTIDSRMQECAEEAVEEHMATVLQPAFDSEKKGRSYAPYARKFSDKVESFLNREMKNSDRYRVSKRGGKSDDEIAKEFTIPVDMKLFSWRGTIDTIMSPIDSIRYCKQILRSGFMAMDTETGHVKAYVGNIDYNFFKYDMINNGRRQVGSTIKPFLYTLAMENGLTPCNELVYGPQTLYDENGREFSPGNENAARHEKMGEKVTLKWGLQTSDNWITTYLMGTTTPYAFARLLYSFGITGKIDPVVAMCLGTHEVSISEMASAYTAFANKGIKASPVYVTHIEDQYGNIIPGATFTAKLDEIFSEQTYVKMIDMLTAVVNGGTGGGIRRYVPSGEMGGKTGTTNDHADAWFMAFSPRLSTACWVGGDEMSIHFDTMRFGQGARSALPITGLFFKKIYADSEIEYKPTDQFPRVPGYGNPCVQMGYEDGDTTVLQPSESNVGIDQMFR